MQTDLLDSSVTEALRAWSTQHDAGIGLVDTLSQCSTICNSSAAKQCFLNAAKQAKDGVEIQILLDELRDFLPPAERAAIAAGWKGGRACLGLQTVIQKRELWAKARSRIRSRMLLPIVTLLLASFVAPLPEFVTGDMSVIGYLFRAALPLTVLCVAWMMVSKALYLRATQATTQTHGRAPAPATAIDRWLLKLPFISMIERNKMQCEFASLLGMLLNSGVPISQALESCALALPNGLYRANVANCARTTAAGNPLTSAMTTMELWSPQFTTALKVGEKSGDLAGVLTRQAGIARERYVMAIEMISEWLPRVIYGIVALFMVINIFQTASSVFSMYQQVL